MLNRRRFLGLMAHAGLALAVVPVLAQLPSTKAYFFGGFPETVAPQRYADGVHDDAPWLQWQFDNHRSPITIPSGTYALGKPLQLTSGVRIIGSQFIMIRDMDSLMTIPDPDSINDVIVTDCWFRTSGDYALQVA